MLGFMTTLATRAGHLLDQAELRGLNREILLEQTGLSDHDWTNPDVRIPSVKYWRLWAAIADRLNEPDIGLEFGSATNYPTSIVGMVVANSATLGDALVRFARFARIAAEDFRLIRKPGMKPGHLEFHPRLLVPGRREPIDEILARVVQGCRDMTGVDLSPLEVRFPYSRPDDISFHRRFFHPDNLFFGEHQIAIIFRNSDLGLPLTDADRNLGYFLEEAARGRLQRLESGGPVDRTRQVIMEMLRDGPPSIGDAAVRLGFSKRTLQRRLKESGLSFRRLVDDVRKELSVVLLENPDLAVYQIAFALGYSEPATFHRAFRQWYGMSPRAFRTQTGPSND